MTTKETDPMTNASETENLEQVGREGPLRKLNLSCDGCAHVRSASYRCQGDAGTMVSCAHPDVSGSNRIGDTTWSTPVWCPLMPEPEHRTIANLRADLAAARARVGALLNDADAMARRQADAVHTYRLAQAEERADVAERDFAEARATITQLQARGTELVTRARPAEVRFKRLREGTPVPTTATAGASGFDLSAMAWPTIDGLNSPKGFLLRSGERMMCLAGLAFEIPIGYEGQVRPRSGNGLKRGLHVALGTIDSDYRGEVGALVWNLGSESVIIEAGMRIAQLVIAPVAMAAMLEVHGELGGTERGANGWGSTDVGGTK